MTEKKNSWREFITLPVLAFICALLLSGIYSIAAPHIAANRQQSADKILLDTLALSAADTELLEQGFTGDSDLLTLRAPRRIYLARRNGQIVAIMVPVTARDGYGGDIDLMVGIGADATNNGKILGVRALSHRETAGLGDRIDSDKSAWIKQFIGKSLNGSQAQQSSWTLKNNGGDFDQITGATITSHAVVDAVFKALQYFDLHREQLLMEAAHE